MSSLTAVLLRPDPAEFRDEFAVLTDEELLAVIRRTRRDLDLLQELYEEREAKRRV